MIEISITDGDQQLGRGCEMGTVATNGASSSETASSGAGSSNGAGSQAGSWADAYIPQTAYPGPPARKKKRRSPVGGKAVDRASLPGLASASDPDRVAHLHSLWDAAHQDSIRLADRYQALASSWRDTERDDADEEAEAENEAEAEVLAVALALRCTRTAARHRINEAHAAVCEFPLAFARLASGEFPIEWFQRLLSRTRNLTAGERAQVDAAAGRWNLAVTAEHFTRRLTRLLALLESRSELPAHLAPEGRRRVELLPPRADGTGCLQVTGPIPEILSIAQRLDAGARAVQDQQRRALERGEDPAVDPDGIVAQRGTPASLARLRYALLRGATLDTAGVHVPADRFRLNVTVSALTLLGASDQPGTLEGAIPIPADMARELAGDCEEWYRILTDPVTGEFLPLPAERYTPTPAMLEHQRLRHPTCAVPGCTRSTTWAAECDHIQEYNHADPTRGGATSIENTHLLCRLHHRLKTAGHIDPVRLPKFAGQPGATQWEINDKIRVMITDTTDLATPGVVEEFASAWNEFQEEQEARRLAAKRRREGPPPAPPPPF